MARAFGRIALSAYPLLAAIASSGEALGSARARRHLRNGHDNVAHRLVIIIIKIFLPAISLFVKSSYKSRLRNLYISIPAAMKPLCRRKPRIIPASVI